MTPTTSPNPILEPISNYSFEGGKAAPILVSLRDHTWKSLRGSIKLLLKHPIIGSKIFWRRCQYTLTRKFGNQGPLQTPEGMKLINAAELCFYWAFFVEEDMF